MSKIYVMIGIIEPSRSRTISAPKKHCILLGAVISNQNLMGGGSRCWGHKLPLGSLRAPQDTTSVVC